MATLLDMLDYIGSSLDKPGRAVRGVLGGRPEEALAAIPFSDALGITDERNAVTGRNLLEKIGLLTGKQEGEGFGWGDVAGMGAEMALDPTNLVGAGLIKKALGAKKMAQQANAVRESLLAKGAMPAEVAALTKAVDAEGKPLKLFHGTADVFDKFDINKADKAGLYGPGVYLTDNPEIAAEYAAGRATSKDKVRTWAEQNIAMAKRDIAGIEKRIAINQDDPRYLATLMGAKKTKEEYLARLENEVSQAPRENIRAHFLDTRNPFDFGDVEAEKRLFANMDTRHLGLQNIPEELSKLGYDASRYPGGQIVGDVPHNVFVGYDPSQIYAPMVAPAAQQMPRLSPLMAALGGYNTGRGARGYP